MLMTLRILRTAKDNDSYYYAKEIEINNKRFKTPFSLLHNSIPSSSIPHIQDNRMYEIWKTFNASDLENVLTNPNKSQKIITKISNQNDSNTRNEAKTYFITINNFDDNPLSLFEDDLIEFLFDSVYLHTDIITFPIIRKLPDYITTSNLRDRLIEFIQNCYEIAETLNNKPIMAIIPPLAPSFISPIVRKYLDLGIRLFCFNFEGSGLTAHFPHYFQVLRTISRYDRQTFEEKIKYIINLKLPVNRNRNQPYPAEDMETPILATDIIGINHITGGPSSKSPSRKKKRTDQPKRKISNINLLDINSYSYHRISNIEDFNKVFANPLIKPRFNDFEQAKYGDRNDFRRKFNYLNMNFEMLQLYNDIINNTPIRDNLFQKSGVRGDIMSKSNLLDAYLNSRSITEFFD